MTSGSVSSHVTPASSSGFQTVSHEPEFQLRALLRVLRKRAVLIATLSLLGALLGFGISKLSPKLYSSTATIELNRLSGSDLGLNDLSGNTSQLSGAAELNTDILTMQKEIQNDTVALSVIDHLKLADSPPYAESVMKEAVPAGAERGLPLERSPQRRRKVLDTFESKLTVVSVKDTRLTSITFNDTNPERAAEIANAVVDAYTRTYADARYAASSNASSWLSQQLSSLKNKVIESQKEVSDYQKRTGIIGGSEGIGTDKGASVTSDNVTMSRFVELNRELTAAEVARIPKEAIYRMTDTLDPDVVLGVASSQLASSAGANSVLAPGGSSVGLLSSLRQQRSQLALQEAIQSNTFGAKSPEMIRLRSQVAELDAQMKTELLRIHDRAGSEFRLAEATENGLRRSIAAQQQEVTRLSTGANQLLLLAQEANSSRQLYQDLYAKLEEANVAAGMKASNVTVVDTARVSARPSTPKTSRNTLSGLGIGVLSGIFLAFLFDMLNDRVLTPEQVEQVGVGPIVGVITLGAGPHGRYKNSSSIRTPVDSPSWLMTSPNSSFAEAIRTLRSSILLSGAHGAPKRILFTSPLRGDGKTAVCFNTAVAFALQGNKVLLIEADMRRPKIREILGITAETGLANYLASTEMPVEEVLIQDDRIPNLHILPGGSPPSMPAELLGSQRFKALLEKASADFDYVLIDSPPLLLVGDALILSSLVDASFVVVRFNRTTEEMLKRTAAKLRAVSAHNLGFILNGVGTRSRQEKSYYGESAQ